LFAAAAFTVTATTATSAATTTATRLVPFAITVTVARTFAALRTRCFAGRCFVAVWFAVEVAVFGVFFV
jgi:hypothetical protein